LSQKNLPLVFEEAVKTVFYDQVKKDPKKTAAEAKKNCLLQ